MRTAERRAPLVGRDGLLAELVGASAVADPAAGAAVLLGGDAGVGKTRLLRALGERATAEGRLVVVGHCLDFGDSALPYLPFTEILGRLLEDEPAVVAAVADRYPAVRRLLPRQRVRTSGSGDPHEPQAADGDGRSNRVDLFAGIHALLEAAARDRALLVVVEDAHWADQSTRDLLTYLFTRPFDARVSLVVSYRSDDIHRRHPLRPALAEWSRLPAVERLHVAPLDDSAVRDLVHALHPDPLPAAEVHEIVARAEGNAFFVEELTGVTGSRYLPVDLAELLLVRLDRLDPKARRVVDAAAVAGRRVSHALLDAVLRAATSTGDHGDHGDHGDPGPALDAALRQAVDALVLEPRGGQRPGRQGYAFRHALLSEAVYDDLLPGERTRWHQAYVTALTEGAVAGTSAELARHARAAGDRETAAAASREAGDEAVRVGAPGEAARHYQTALELLGPRTGDEVPLVIAAAEALSDAGDPYRSLRLVSDELARLPDDVDPLARARLLLAKVRAAFVTEVDFAPVDLSAEALVLIPEEPLTPLRAAAVMLHAQALRGSGSLDEAERVANQAIRLGEQLGLTAIAHGSALTLARVADRAGDLDAAIARLDAVVAGAERGDLDGNEDDGEVEIAAVHQLAHLLYRAGRVREARDAFLRTMDLARRRGRPFSPWGLDARASAALTSYVLGEWEDTLNLTDTSGEEVPEFASSYLTAQRLNVLAARGDRAGLDLLVPVRRVWDQDGGVVADCVSAAVDLYGEGGDLDAALAIQDDGLATLRRLWPGEVLWPTVRFAALSTAQLARRAASGSTAEREAWGAVVDRLGGRAQDVLSAVDLTGPTVVEGRAWRDRAEAEILRFRWLAALDPPALDDLVGAWRTSVASFAALGHVYETARSQARLAAVLHAAGETAEARTLAGSARSVAERLGAAPLLAELRLVGGASRDATRAGTDASTPLTARELEILALVADGRTNGEIGRQLFISTKTVSVHVSNILAKLGAAGRTEAAALARREGLLTR